MGKEKEVGRTKRNAKKRVKLEKITMARSSHGLRLLSDDAQWRHIVGCMAVHHGLMPPGMIQHGMHDAAPVLK